MSGSRRAREIEGMRSGSTARRAITVYRAASGLTGITGVLGSRKRPGLPHAGKWAACTLA